MKARMKTLLTALLGVAVLGAGASVHADGKPEGWRDGGRFEQRWDDRRQERAHPEGWRHHHPRHPHASHRHAHRHHAYFHGPHMGYAHSIHYGPTVYRHHHGASLIIDLPPIIFR